MSDKLTMNYPQPQQGYRPSLISRMFTTATTYMSPWQLKGNETRYNCEEILVNVVYATFSGLSSFS